jgi:hypothetical protein
MPEEKPAEAGLRLCAQLRPVRGSASLTQPNHLQWCWSLTAGGRRCSRAAGTLGITHAPIADSAGTQRHGRPPALRRLWKGEDMLHDHARTFGVTAQFVAVENAEPREVSRFTVLDQVPAEAPMAPLVQVGEYPRSLSLETARTAALGAAAGAQPSTTTCSTSMPPISMLRSRLCTSASRQAFRLHGQKLVQDCSAHAVLAPRQDTDGRHGSRVLEAVVDIGAVDNDPIARISTIRRHETARVRRNVLSGPIIDGNSDGAEAPSTLTQWLCRTAEVVLRCCLPRCREEWAGKCHDAARAG